MDKSKTQHDFKGLTDFFQVFTSGKHTDSAGRTRTWTNNELDEIVSNTMSRVEKNIFNGAPFVVGHPKTNDPAFGWLLDVRRDGNELLIKGDKLHDEFAEGVEKGLWPNRSIRIGKGKDGLYLRHVGFLGAAPPAVDGMDSVYAADEGEFYDYADADTVTPNTLKRFMRSMRDLLIEKFGLETADKTIPDYQIDSMDDHVTQLREKATPESTTSFNNPEGDPPMSKFTQEQLDEAVTEGRKQERTKLEGDFAKKETGLNDELKTEREKRLRTDFTKQVDDLITANKLTPALAEGVVDFMLQLDATGSTEVEFEFSVGEGDKKTVTKKTPMQFFNDFVGKIGKQVDTSESDAGSELPGGVVGDFVAAHGEPVDGDRLDLHRKALDYQAKHDGVEYIDAVRLVEQQEG